VSFLETERLIIRTWMPSDAQAYAAIILDPDVARHLEPCAPLLRTPEDVGAWIEAEMDAQERTGLSRWPLIRKEDRRLIGRCGLHRRADGDVEIGYVIARDAWGRGYATEAARAVVRYAFDVAGLPRLWAFVGMRNAASVAVIRRIGGHFDRVVRACRGEVLRYVIGPPPSAGRRERGDTR